MEKEEEDTSNKNEMKNHEGERNGEENEKEAQR